MRLPGLEPGSQAWKAGVLPLYQKRFLLFSFLFLLFILFLFLFIYFFFICYYYFFLIILFILYLKKINLKIGLRRESNPGHPHPKRVFYHLTTKPSVLFLSFFLLFFLSLFLFYYLFSFFLFFF